MSNDGGNSVQVDGERLSKLEVSNEHMSKSFDETKEEVKQIRQAVAGMGSSLAVLVEIAEQNKKFEEKYVPMLDRRFDAVKAESKAIESRVRANEKFIWRVVGAMGVIVAAGSIFGPAIAKYILG